MGRVPITIMGYRCERCEHEWVPRDFDTEPRVCPKCKSPYWNRPIKQVSSYEEFSKIVRRVLEVAARPLTWTEVRTEGKLSQMFPNNRWVRRMELDIGLQREKNRSGVILWSINHLEVETIADQPASETTEQSAKATNQESFPLE